MLLPRIVFMVLTVHSLCGFQYLSQYVDTLPSEVFEQFLIHMSKCANAHRASAERENRRIMLTNLFIYCDHSGVSHQALLCV